MGRGRKLEERRGPSCAGGRRRIRELRTRSCGRSLWNIVRLHWEEGSIRERSIGMKGGGSGVEVGSGRLGHTEEGLSGFAGAFGL